MTRRTTLKNITALKSNWGLFLFCLLGLFALLRLLGQTPGGHYQIFTQAASTLWSGNDPYGSDFGTGVGFYFYSPTCAMFFYSIFDWLGSITSKLFALLTYMSLSFVIFVFGAKAFLKSIRCPRGIVNWFWILSAPHLLPAIAAHKIEILMTGVLFFSASWLIDQKKLVFSALLLAMTLSWKFQPLPTIGLLMLVCFLVKTDWKWPLATIGFSVGWFFLPYLFFDFDFLAEINQTWNFTLSHFIEESFLNFQNIFAFFHQSFGISISYFWFQFISVIDGAALAFFLWYWLTRLESAGLNQKKLFEQGILLAISLGAFFTVTYSPLNQNNGYILYSPLILGSLYFWNLNENLIWRQRGKIVLTFSFAIMILLYSDIVPVGVRDLFRSLAIKPIAPLMLGLLVLFFSFIKIEKKTQIFN